jgi:hypothetical protein
MNASSTDSTQDSRNYVFGEITLKRSRKEDQNKKLHFSSHVVKKAELSSLMSEQR